MPVYHYKCERCGEILVLEMTISERDKWMERKKDLGREDKDFIHHAKCPETGTSDLIPQALRVFVGKYKKPTPVIYKSKGYTKNNDLN